MQTMQKSEGFSSIGAMFAASAGEVKKVSSLAGAAMLVALNILLGMLDFGSFTIRISIGFLPIAVAGMLYGPVLGTMVGAVGDILGAVLFPQDGFFFGFVISTAISGFLFGLAFYRRRITLPRAVITILIEEVITNVFLTTVWLYIMSLMPGYSVGSTTFFALLWSRVVKNAITIPIYAVLWFVLATALQSAMRRIPSMGAKK